MTDPTLLISDENRVRLIKLNRPAVKNAFNNDMYAALGHTINDAMASKEVRVIVITGNGDIFSAGQDLSEMKNASLDEASGFEILLDAFAACDKPILTAINGLALGIGVTMLLHTDINHIAEGARIKCPFVPLGIVPEAGSSALFPMIMGPQKAANFLFTSPWLSSSEAVEYGLVFEELPAEQLLPTVIAKAEEIAAQPPGSVQATKRLLKTDRALTIKTARNNENTVFLERLNSPENHEAIAAFFEKRVPDFSKF